MPLRSPGPLCRGPRCHGLRHGTGQFLAADPDGGDPDEQAEQPDPRGNHEATGKPTARV
jgi:hypothetical protein